MRRYINIAKREALEAKVDAAYAVARQQIKQNIRWLRYSSRWTKTDTALLLICIFGSLLAAGVLYKFILWLGGILK